jgi:glutamyl-tRNA reductase
VVPTLKALQEHAETVRAAEWLRVRKKLGELTPEQEQAMEALTRSLMNKWLHTPMVELKAASPAERAAMIEFMHRLYAIEPRE